MNDTFWDPPSPSTPTNCHLQSVVKERNLKLDVVAFCSTFTNLLFLASSDAVEMLRDDIAKLLTNIWERDMRSKDTSRWMEEVWFADITHLYIEYDVQAPFMTLYSMYSRGSMDSDAMFARHTHFPNSGRVHSLQCARSTFPLDEN